MSKFIYPVCSKTFNKWLCSNIKYINLYNEINPKLFDVSLRDGLQNIKKEEHQNYTTEKKIQIYKDICLKYNPNYIEVGSLVSNKVLPIFSDSLEIYANNLINKEKNFLLISSSSKLNSIIDSKCNNISLITSVSESFQMKNVKKTIMETKSSILEILYEVFSNENIQNPRIKLYLSCIDYCPIEGKISDEKIINEIKFYYEKCKPDIICLSDTCAKLTHNSFLNIINLISREKIPFEKFSLHLHVSNDNFEEAKKIFFTAIEYNIREFDVSFIETGGCSITMNSLDSINTQIKPNLTYELYYKFIVDYIIEKTKIS